MVFPIGHSNRPIWDFVDLLWINEVAKVIDVRTIPWSHHNPRFHLDALPASLAAAGIDCAQMPGLGGSASRADLITEHGMA